MIAASILLVEDNLINRALARALLRRRGHTVLEAGNMAEARTALRTWTPDLILLDINFPGGSGDELLGEIRRMPALMRAPVIAVTAYAMQGDRERLLSVGFDGYISKPIHAATFCQEIESYLGRGAGK